MVFSFSPKLKVSVQIRPYRIWVSITHTVATRPLLLTLGEKMGRWKDMGSLPWHVLLDYDIFGHLEMTSFQTLEVSALMAMVNSCTFLLWPKSQTWRSYCPHEPRRKVFRHYSYPYTPVHHHHHQLEILIDKPASLCKSYWQLILYHAVSRHLFEEYFSLLTIFHHSHLIDNSFVFLVRALYQSLTWLRRLGISFHHTFSFQTPFNVDPQTSPSENTHSLQQFTPSIHQFQVSKVSQHEVHWPRHRYTPCSCLRRRCGFCNSGPRSEQ